MSEYRIYLDEELICKTAWPPQAQAAWHRASRDRDAAQHSGQAVLLKDGQELANVQPRTLIGHPWSDKAEPVVGLHEVAKSLNLLLRHQGFDTRQLADKMTARGLPTTRAHIDALRGTTQGKRAEVAPCELVVMIDAMVSLLKTEAQD